MQQYGPVNPTAKHHQVECDFCGVSLAAGSLCSHMEMQHIRSAKQDDIYGASNIILPCPSNQVIFHLVKDVVIILKSSI
jgi:hypothetical protein